MPDPYRIEVEAALRDLLPRLSDVRDHLQHHGLLFSRTAGERLIGQDLQLMFGLIDHMEHVATDELAAIEGRHRGEDCGHDVRSHEPALDKPLAFAAADHPKAHPHPDERELAHAFDQPIHAEREC